MTQQNHEERDRTWMNGYRMAWTRIFEEARRTLGYDNPAVAATAWIVEREETIVQLRDLCRTFGDNDWTDATYLPDIIEKHLAKQLYASRT